MIVPPSCFGAASLAAQDFISEVGGNVVVADDSANEAEDDAAVGVCVESFGKGSNGAVDEDFLEVFLAIVDLQHLIDGEHEGELKITGSDIGHDLVLIILDAAPELDQLLASEFVDALRGLVEGQHVVACGQDAF